MYHLTTVSNGNWTERSTIRMGNRMGPSKIKD